MFISWGNGADKTGILSVTDEEGTEVVRRSLDSENDYTLVENLAPGTTYHVALLKSDDAVLWKDDVKTKSVTGKFPLLKYQQVDGYMLVQLLNLPDDVSSYKVKLDGQEINIVNKMCIRDSHCNGRHQMFVLRNWVFLRLDVYKRQESTFS